MEFSCILKLFTLACFIAKSEEVVTFALEPMISSNSETVVSVSSSSSSSSSSDSDSSELLRIDSEPNGRFSHLKKDDDLISIKKKKKKKKRKVTLNSGKPLIRPHKTLSEGKLSVGYVYNLEWHKDMSYKAGNGFTEELEKMTGGIVTEPVNVGWWLFTFGSGKSSVSKTIFKFRSSLPVKVSLVDLFCRGDSFAVLNNGKLISQSSRILADPECLERMISPNEALTDGRWSNVIFELDAGDHLIEIKTVDSPVQDGGIAAIKFDHILPSGTRTRRVSRNKVCRGYNGLVVVTESVASYDAEMVCLNLKMNLAKVYSEESVRKTIKSCLSKSGKVWAVDKKSLGEVGAIGVDGKFMSGKKFDSLPILCRVIA